MGFSGIWCAGAVDVPIRCDPVNAPRADAPTRGHSPARVDADLAKRVPARDGGIETAWGRRQ